MSEDNPKWRDIPILRELTKRWAARRARKIEGEAKRPFSRSWEHILKDAAQTSAEQRAESDRDARMLEAEGLLKLIPNKARPHLIESVLILFDSEPRLKALFPEFQQPPKPVFDPQSIEWARKLAFVKESKTTVAWETLQKLNEFLKSADATGPLVPIKERSLQIFGEEKRLDDLSGTTLFAEGRLTLADLRCETVGEPFGWEKGTADTGFIMVLENASTWNSYAQWNQRRGFFSAVVYGCGNRFFDSIHMLGPILKRFKQPQRVLYFGDMDTQGLRIPLIANTRASALGMPVVEADVWSYLRLIERGGNGVPSGEDPVELPTAAVDWLKAAGPAARVLAAAGRRLAQEHIGWEYLRDQASWKPPQDLTS